MRLASAARAALLGRSTIRSIHSTNIAANWPVYSSAERPAITIDPSVSQKFVPIKALVPRPTLAQILARKWDFGKDLLQTLEHEERVVRASRRNFPDFYPGSVVRVTYKDTMTQKYPTALVGIVIARNGGNKLQSTFVIRQSIMERGFEKTFHVFDPKIESMEVLRFARRRRARLYYLRDRPMTVFTH